MFRVNSILIRDNRLSPFFFQVLKISCGAVYQIICPQRLRDNCTMQEYTESKEKSRYKLLAQKLSQHLENLAEDPNTRTRWLWELIQNAKDVPNQFGQVKIRLDINDNSLRFSHNGDPFRVSDLESVVSQYSSKPSENKAESDTTGKYGTGFITTYVLSRKLSIKGILKVTGRVVSQSQSDDGDISWSEDEDEDEGNSKKQKKRKDKIKIESLSSIRIPEKDEESELSIIEDSNGMSKQNLDLSGFLGNTFTQESMNPEINQSIEQSLVVGQMDEKPQVLESKKLQKQEGVQYKDFFRKFKIKLNRQYKDRDNELIKKLMRNEEKIMKELGQLENEEVWERKVDDFDTSFTYEKLDGAAFDIIREGIQTLKVMFPYALLFNKKLFSIEVRDKRKDREFEDFKITKEDSFKVNRQLAVSKCMIIDGENKEEVHLAYTMDSDSSSFVAVPVFVFKEDGDQRVRLLTVPPGMPKIFKEFPLIGAKDTGFNYVFTSRKFYPNQTRSNLMLKIIEGRKTEKTETNWNVLQRIFKLANLLFSQLSTYVTHNEENFLQMWECPFLGNEEVFFREKFFQFRDMTAKLNTIQFSNKTTGKMDRLHFLYGKDCSILSDKKFSGHVNEVFKFLFPSASVLSLEKHQAIHDNIFKYQWTQFSQCYSLKVCLSEVAKLKYSGMINHIGGKEEAFAKTEEIYQFLNKYAPAWITEGSAEQGFQIVLTNKQAYKKMGSRANGQALFHPKSNLRFKKNLPKSYQKICKAMELDIEENMVHDKLAKYFKGLTPFTIDDVITLVTHFLEIPKTTDVTSMVEKKIRLLIQFMKTFNIGKLITDLVCCWKQYSMLEEFSLEKEQLKQIPNDLAQRYTNHLKVLFLHELNKNFDSSSICTLTTLASNLDFSKIESSGDFKKTNDKTKSSISWLDAILKLQGEKTIVHKNLAWNSQIKSNSELSWMRYYPNDSDLRFYEHMKAVWNKKCLQYRVVKLQALPSQLVHPSMTYLKQNKQTNYKTLFYYTPGLFSQLISNSKQTYLDYVDLIKIQLRKNKSEEVQEKYKTHSSVVKIRHKALLELTELNEEEADVVHDLVKNRRHLGTLKSMVAQISIPEINGVVQDFLTKKKLQEK